MSMIFIHIFKSNTIRTDLSKQAIVATKKDLRNIKKKSV